METFRLFSTDPEINPLAEIKPRLVRTLFTEPRERAAFEAVDGTASALAAGYHPSEVPDLLKAFSLYRTATNVSDADALAAVLDPDSKARRLMGYGGRFTESPENFREGLRLLDMLRSWFPLQVDAVDAKNQDSVTRLNLDIDVATAKSLPAMEKFLMESIALDPNARLDSQDPEELFGMEGNKAMPASSSTTTPSPPCATRGTSTAPTSCRCSTATSTSLRTPTTGRSRTPSRRSS